MEANVNEWLNLIVRWIHVIFGIMWIGSSIFFIWLDSAFKPLKEKEEGVVGEVWMVHGGGFYHVKKKYLKADEIPHELHWFKWEAGFTWISGICLLGVVYYMNGGALLVDPQVADISLGTAIAVSVGLLITAWLIYDTLWNSPLAKKNPGLLIGICFLLVLIAAYGLTWIFSARAAYIHVGAMLGTVMAANVWVRILPAQSIMLNAVKKGESFDPAPGLRAKLRSRHNNYITFPVIFIMISNHFPSTYGHHYNWLILGILILASAIVKHFMNIDENVSYWALPSAAVTLAALFAIYLIYLTPNRTAELTALPADHAEVGEVTFNDARQIINQRCIACHSAKPTDDIFTAAPLGVMFDTPERIKAFADRIKMRAVDSRTMPFNNKTQMTELERKMLGKWIEQGAKIN